VGLFDKGLFASESVLTSAAIQTRFVEWSKIAKRKNCKIPEKYFKLQEVSTKIHEETIQNSGVLPQREREENVEREEGGREDAHAREEAFTPPSVSDVESFFKEQIPDTFWSFEKCTVESKKFFNYYEKYGWKTRNGPIVKWENAASGWIDNDGKFEEEKKIKNNQKSKFPDVYDRSFAEKASADVLKQYFEHIKSLGWYMEGRDGRGQSVWKKAEI
jgi:hypothetical protein